MPIDSITSKSGVNCSEKSNIPDTLKTKTGEVTQKAASLNSDPQELLLKAQRNALEAKEAAKGAINRFYQESKVSEKKAEKMLGELEEAIQLALNVTKKKRGIDDKESGQSSDRTAVLPDNQKSSKLSKKILNPGHNPMEIVSDLKKSLLGNKPTDAEVKEEFYRLVMRKSPQLRQLIDDLTEDKAKIRTDKIIAEARSEIVAARTAVNKAQEEINVTKEEAKKAFLEAENTRKSAELIINQVRQGIVPQFTNDVTGDRKEAANSYDHQQANLNLAKEKLRKDAEELKAYRLQAQIVVKRAQDEANKARAEAEAVRREAQGAIDKSAQESRQAKSDLELARLTMQEATVMAEKKTYDKFFEEIKKMREEVEITNRKAFEAIARARSESQKAREELDSMKKASEAAVITARKEALEAQKAEELAKKSMLEAISQSQEESRKIKAEAESSVTRANEALMLAKKDIIDITRHEIISTRQAFESPDEVVQSSEVKAETTESRKLDSEHVATVLHEMRTPLHSISGFAKLLNEEGVSDDATRKEFLSIMVQQSDSLNKLLDDLSHLLNNKNEVLSINSGPVSPNKIITEAIDSVRTEAEQKKNLISHNLTSALPEIKADAFRIKQVIINLLTNAIKFSPESHPIFVKAGVRDRELVVQVTDSGIGIPKAELSAIFDKYYQAENHGSVAGTGLGLYICQNIIKAHGGRIWAESVEGQGSTFSFSLPMAAVNP